MAKISIEGLDEFISELAKLGVEVDKINRGALGEAAGYVADQISNALEAMPVREPGQSEHRLFGATEDEKAQIIENFGISKFRKANGSTDTSIGFTGYVDTHSPKYGNRVPTGMLMQCINYGTEFRQGTHTIDNALRVSKGTVSEIIQGYIDEKVSEIIS